jgi:hypothetical protein
MAVHKDSFTSIKLNQQAVSTGGRPISQRAAFDPTRSEARSNDAKASHVDSRLDSGSAALQTPPFSGRLVNSQKGGGCD